MIVFVRKLDYNSGNMVYKSKKPWPTYFIISVWVFGFSLFINITFGGIVEDKFLEELSKTMQLWNYGDPGPVVNAFRIFFDVSDYISWIDSVFIVIALLVRWFRNRRIS